MVLNIVQLYHQLDLINFIIYYLDIDIVVFCGYVIGWLSSRLIGGDFVLWGKGWGYIYGGRLGLGVLILLGGGRLMNRYCNYLLWEIWLPNLRSLRVYRLAFISNLIPYTPNRFSAKFKSTLHKWSRVKFDPKLLLLRKASLIPTLVILFWPALI